MIVTPYGVMRAGFLPRASSFWQGQGREVLLHALGVLAGAQPPEDRQRRLQPRPCRPRLTLLGVHLSVDVQQTGLTIGKDDAAR